MSARNSSRFPPRESSRFTLLRTVRIASRVRSDTLRAPVREQRCIRAEYSSSERRTLIMRDRGFITAIMDSNSGRRYERCSFYLQETGRRPPKKNAVLRLDINMVKLLILKQDRLRPRWSHIPDGIWSGKVRLADNLTNSLPHNRLRVTSLRSLAPVEFKVARLSSGSKKR